MLTLRGVKRPMLRSTPLAWIPVSARDYPDFLAWWHQIGRQNPTDSQGWSGISGPGVIRDRTELIPPEAWNALPASERELIEAWLERLSIVLYD